jgi:hypothetical protein
VFSFLLVILFPIVFFFIFLHSFAFGNSLSLSLLKSKGNDVRTSKRERFVKHSFVSVFWLIAVEREKKKGITKGKKHHCFPPNFTPPFPHPPPPPSSSRLAISSSAVETFRSASRVSTGMGWDFFFFFQEKKQERRRSRLRKSI